MIIVYAGSQPDPEERAEARFPQAAEAEIKRRIRGLFQDMQPRLVFGALAAGADIIIAEAAREEGIPFRALLPFDVDTFRTTSVSGSGADWTARFDRLIAEVDVHCLDEEVQDGAYVQHNLAMLDAVVKIAEDEGERLWCLLVRPAPDAARSGSVTDDMGARAEGRGILTIDLNPVAARARTFVVMPYGTKYDPILRRDIDCDSVFRRVYRPLLEDLDLEWNRADLATDSGIIHIGMIDDLANSRVVIADLTATNFNVAYELGLRHVFARRSTVLIAPKVSGYRSSTPPFDIGPIRAHAFDRSLHLTDDEAERAIKALRPVLAQAVETSALDSPVHEWFKTDAIVAPFVRRSTEGSADVEVALRAEVRNAIRSSEGAEMRAAADGVAAVGIDEPTRSALRIELAVGLIDEGDYLSASNLLEVAEPEPESPLHRLWLQKMVMALRRVAENSSDGEYDGLVRRAEGLLRLALDLGYEDSESYGIWAGLLKRKILRGSLGSLEEAAAFELMTEYYGRGFRADPQPYTGLNYAMSLRLSAYKKTLAASQVDDLNEALVVARFLNNLDLQRDASMPWALMTDAELKLHFALRDGDGDGVEAAGIAYAKASNVASADVRRSAREQLRFLIVCGDDPLLLDPIIQVLTREGDSK